MRKHGREARCRWTSRSAGNGDAARDHIKYLERQIEDLSRHEVHQAASSSANRRDGEMPPSAQSQSAAGQVDNGQESGLNIRAVPAKRKRSRGYIDDPLLDFSGVINSPTRQPQMSKQQEDCYAREVNAMMGAVPDGPHEQGIFGTSSAANFIKQVKRIIDAKVHSPDDHQHENLEIGNENQFVSRVERERKREVQLEPEVGLDYVLPTRKTADSLMSLYWELVHPLYPFVDREGMYTVYESL
jgi:hypothetical protein